MRLRISGMTAGLTVGVTAAVGVACAAGAYIYGTRHYETLLENTRKTALAQGELIRVALEHQMMENDRSLIGRLTESFGREPGVESVIVLDREGRMQYSSKELGKNFDLDLNSPTCQACHRFPPGQRTSSRVIETNQGAMLRTVVPVRNRPECHQCHDPAHDINGILIVDYNAEEIRATVNRDLRWMAGGSAALALLLIAAIAGVVRLVVIRRLQRFETTARLIAAGDLNRRMPVQGTDTLSWLGREFNTMADTMTGLLQDVRNQRERLETVINSIDDGIVVLDVERKVVAANEAYLRRRVRSRDEVLGAACHDAGSGTCGADDCPTLACLELGERQVRLCERTNSGGETVLEEIHASPIRNPSGAVAHVVEVWRDISERRAAEARLAESHRLASLGMLASGFSHELNTPLATILVCVEGIQRSIQASGATEMVDSHRIAENASIAREQLLRCRGITQHFLRLSRGQDSSANLVNLEPTCVAVARLIEPTARERSVTVRLGPFHEELHVRANEAELQHVLLNLMLNAIQACEQGGTVELEAHGGDPIRIHVTDDGCGISPGDLKRVFDPFFSGRRGGTGLGLFFSMDFVRHWGGSIDVKSVPGSGSTFAVLLPAAGTADEPMDVQ